MDDLFNNEHCDLSDLSNKSQFVGIYKVDKIEIKQSKQKQSYLKVRISDESANAQVYIFSPESTGDGLAIGRLIYLKGERREHSQKHYWHTLDIAPIPMRKAVELFGGNCVAHMVEWKDAFSQMTRINNRLLKPILNVLMQYSPIQEKSSKSPLSLDEIRLELMLNWLAQIDFNRTYNGSIVILGWLYWLLCRLKDDEQAKSTIFAKLMQLRDSTEVNSPRLWAEISTIWAYRSENCLFEMLPEQRDLILIDLVFNYTQHATDFVFTRTGLCKNTDDF